MDGVFAGLKLNYLLSCLICDIFADVISILHFMGWATENHDKRQNAWFVQCHVTKSRDRSAVLFGLRQTRLMSEPSPSLLV
jgi:hypothetical protein